MCHCILGHSAIAELSFELQYSTTKGVSEVGLLVCMCLPSQPFTVYLVWWRIIPTNFCWLPSRLPESMHISLKESSSKPAQNQSVQKSVRGRFVPAILAGQLFHTASANAGSWGLRRLLHTGSVARLRAGFVLLQHVRHVEAPERGFSRAFHRVPISGAITG